MTFHETSAHVSYVGRRDLYDKSTEQVPRDTGGGCVTVLGMEPVFGSALPASDRGATMVAHVGTSDVITDTMLGGSGRVLVPPAGAASRHGGTRSMRARNTLPVAERFWAKVDRRGTNECWLWTGATKPKGYGLFSRGRRHEGIVTSSRMAYELTHGPIPVGMVVRHRCDNPPCVNPSHLELGTYSDNLHDAYRRVRRSGR